MTCILLTLHEQDPDLLANLPGPGSAQTSMALPSGLGSNPSWTSPSTSLSLLLYLTKGNDKRTWEDYTRQYMPHAEHMVGQQQTSLPPLTFSLKFYPLQRDLWRCFLVGSLNYAVDTTSVVHSRPGPTTSHPSVLSLSPSSFAPTSTYPKQPVGISQAPGGLVHQSWSQPGPHLRLPLSSDSPSQTLCI